MNTRLPHLAAQPSPRLSAPSSCPVLASPEGALRGEPWASAEAAKLHSHRQVAAPSWSAITLGWPEGSPCPPPFPKHNSMSLQQPCFIRAPLREPGTQFSPPHPSTYFALELRSQAYPFASLSQGVAKDFNCCGRTHCACPNSEEVPDCQFEEDMVAELDTPTSAWLLARGRGRSRQGPRPTQDTGPDVEGGWLTQAAPQLGLHEGVAFPEGSLQVSPGAHQQSASHQGCWVYSGTKKLGGLQAHN